MEVNYVYKWDKETNICLADRIFWKIGRTDTCMGTSTHNSLRPPAICVCANRKVARKGKYLFGGYFPQVGVALGHALCRRVPGGRPMAGLGMHAIWTANRPHQWARLIAPLGSQRP